MTSASVAEIIAASPSSSYRKSWLRAGSGPGVADFGPEARTLFKMALRSIARRHRCDRHEPRNRYAVPREHNFVARFGAANQLGQLPLGVANGNQHVLFPVYRKPICSIDGSLSNLALCVTI
jgi:hypothetical protein